MILPLPSRNVTHDPAVTVTFAAHRQAGIRARGPPESPLRRLAARPSRPQRPRRPAAPAGDPSPEPPHRRVLPLADWHAANSTRNDVVLSSRTAFASEINLSSDGAAGKTRSLSKVTSLLLLEVEHY